MADDQRTQGGSGDLPPSPRDRLESWKEIAAYLRRDVRTVQRWERTDGLPVYRHKRPRRSIPYAYKAELDAWWTDRSDGGPAVVGAESDVPVATVLSTGAPASRHRHLRAGVAVVLALAVGGSAYWMSRRGLFRRPSTEGTSTLVASIAVLPFLDLSEGMKNEEFADGITEELIDRLNKTPGLRSPAPTSTFYFKNKHASVVEVGKALHVAFVLDGSVRKSGARVRVAARLIRAADADVVWSDTYDRTWIDILSIQDDIAAEVTKALRASIAASRGIAAPS